MSVEPANSTKTLPNSLLAEEEEEVGFMIFVGPTPLKTPKSMRIRSLRRRGRTFYEKKYIKISINEDFGSSRLS